MEISKSITGNPIVQDSTKSGAPRFIKHGPVPHHYGSIPQTWEDPRSTDSGSGGDNDPVDVLDISEAPVKRGDIQTVRVIGALALVDGDEIDWKVIAVNSADHRWAEIRDISQLEFQRPGLVDDIRYWYRVYKVAEGKKENRYKFGGRALGREKAMSVISDSHTHWKNLVSAVDRSSSFSLDLFEPFI